MSWLDTVCGNPVFALFDPLGLDHAKEKSAATVVLFFHFLCKTLHQNERRASFPVVFRSERYSRGDGIVQQPRPHHLPNTHLRPCPLTRLHAHSQLSARRHSSHLGVDGVL